MPTSDYLKLEQRLVLAGWACRQLGWEEDAWSADAKPANARMLAHLKDAPEGYEANGKSGLVRMILARGAKCLVPKGDLERYDENVRAHLAFFNRHRKEPLTLRYFQHLSLLVTELFLDQFFNHEKALRKSLAEFVEARNARRSAVESPDPVFGPDDLRKLAFWMATGSGKTILMHFHYRQYLHYGGKAKRPLDNILLVTPDEALSQQHIEQMEEAGIPCARFSLEDSGLETVKKNAVRVIEITKFVETKKGGGVSVPVEAFEGNNLIFVDEGHRGASSEAGKWVGFRDKLAETGFTFEYSATFGQAMTTARDDAMTREYGKAILFDYSYKYFYGDGFGKDFEVLNLRAETTPDQTKALLLGNLLAFHEQKRAFQTKSAAMLRYHLADPLWVFVGSTVNKSKNDKQAKESDVLTVVQFLSAVLRNERGWVQKGITRILAGKSGIEDEGGHDVFASRFARLKKWSTDADEIYRDILGRVFHAASGGRLHVGDIKGKAGELGLKVGGAEDYFGLVYIGDTGSFKSLIEEGCPEVGIEDDQLAEGLFEGIKKAESRINILVGAKKFMQGWDSWRVTNMGLLNIGRSEGSEIIQLFGRGVRLKGYNRSLKRSGVLPAPDGKGHPLGIELLERLNIFAIRANYMAQFRDYLEREGIEPTGVVELKLPILRNDAFLKKGLIAPRLPKDKTFAQTERILLAPDREAKVILDFSVKVERIAASDGRIREESFASGDEEWLPPARFGLLDWERLYLDILEFKEERGFHNLLVRPDHPRQLLEASDPKLYGLVCDKAVLNPTRAEQAGQLQSVMSSVLKKYVENFYRKRQQRWESERMEYKPLSPDDENFQDYIVRVPRNDRTLIEEVKSIIDEGKRIYKELCSDLPGIYLDRHLYQPLLISKGSKVTSVPPALNESERHFVADLIKYCQSKPAALEGKELFLLRNLSRGKGIGFFENSGFYPDFILWITAGKSQRVIFVEPHGMLNEDHPTINPKVNLHRRLRTQAAAVLKRSKIKGFELDSFIVSATSYDDLRKRFLEDGKPWTRERFATAHILFFGEDDDLGYLEDLIST